MKINGRREVHRYWWLILLLLIALTWTIGWQIFAFSVRLACR